MERRRRALGLKNTNSTPEKNVAKSLRQPSTSGEGSKFRSDEKTPARGKVSQKNQTPSSVTPKQTVVQPESPCSPMQSPGSQMVFPGTLASPEIEVSWDWSCSQVPKDMLPLKKSNRKPDRKAQLPDLPTINMFHRPWPPRQRQITEEENQKRLEYYKNILAIKSIESSSEVLYDSTNNNLEDISSDEVKSFNTPKRPTTRSSSTSKKKNEENSLFDDSANDLMIECSQAIEEKLKNGEIDMGPIVDIQISQSKRLHSPGIGTNISHKKSCHGRVNLFPENNNHEHPCSVKAKTKDNNDSELFRSPLSLDNITHQRDSVLKKPEESDSIRNEVNPGNTSLNRSLVNKSSGCMTHMDQHVLNINKIEEKVSQIPLNSNCENLNHNIVDKLCKPQSTSSNLNHLIKPQSSSVNVLRNRQNAREVNFTTNQVKEMQRPKFNSTLQEKSSDLTSLLDDDFDMELSNLDVDSLCRDDKPKSKQAMNSAPKLCTQQEIEAKRQAALQKLMMKKKR